MSLSDYLFLRTLCSMLYYRHNITIDNGRYQAKFVIISSWAVPFNFATLYQFLERTGFMGMGGYLYNYQGDYEFSFHGINTRQGDIVITYNPEEGIGANIEFEQAETTVTDTLTML